MFNISYNGIITVNRGDSFSFPLKVNLGTTLQPILFNLDENSVIYVGVMEPNQPFENALIRKRYTKKNMDKEGNVIIRFDPRDTQCVLPGTYYYQVKLQQLDPENSEKYDVVTVVDKTHFFVLE